jgi:FKBP-type peptidyl-prolyl cis-trans isomerase FkpA
MPPFVKSGDKVTYQLNLVSIKTKAEFEKEQEAKLAEVIKKDTVTIVNHLKEKGITGAQKTPKGVYYVIDRPGTGANVTAGKEVNMNYTGALLNGTKFDSNVDPEFKHVQPFKFILGQGQVIKGWDDGIAMFNKGAKGRLFIPSSLAYGTQSPSPEMPPSSILVFDVEVVDFKNAPAKDDNAAMQKAMQEAMEAQAAQGAKGK